MSANTEQAPQTQPEPSTTSQEQNTAPTPVPPQALEGEALAEAILKQVEFYFSEQNLRKDAYLLSQMDENNYVAISTIASFSKMRALTEDQNLIVESLTSSTVVQLSEDKSKIKPREGERKTLILYNLHPNTTQEDIEGLIKQGNFNAFVAPDVNNTWFVTFQSESAATDAIFFLREQKLHDQTVRVRFKPETVIRSLVYIPDPVVPFVPPPFVAQGRGNWNNVYWSGDPNNPGEYNRNAENKEFRGNRGFRKQRKGDHRKGQYTSDKRRNTNRKKGGRESKKSGNTSFQLGPSHFPPLPTSSSKETKPGYSEEFTRYSREEIVATIQGLQDVPKPELPENAAFTLTVPNRQLESLQTYNENEDLQEGISVPMVEVVKVKHPHGNNAPEKKQQPKPTTPPAQPAQPTQPQEKASKPAQKPAAEHKPAEQKKEQHQQRSNQPNPSHQSNQSSRTWSQVVTKPEKDTEKENTSPDKEDSPKAGQKQAEPAARPDALPENPKPSEQAAN